MTPRYFAIFGAMRTGSNLLERTLASYDGLRTEGELFNPGFIGFWRNLFNSRIRFNDFHQRIKYRLF